MIKGEGKTEVIGPERAVGTGRGREGRTHVVRIFPDAESCLRLVRALAVEMHENWLEATRYLNMDHLREHKKEALRALAA